ncbi:hypothetical protein [Streptomyces sp. NPDC086519]|uniref:hypothetical protein n=1 Tax=Streptomyces sp. NPDC086519 TaxID=3154863 RepID=UPI003440B296
METVNSLQGLFGGGGAPSFGQWRHLVRPRLGGPADRLLAGPLPGRGCLPDLLTPTPGMDSQTGGVTSYRYGRSGNVLTRFTPDDTVYSCDWTPVWSLRNR